MTSGSPPTLRDLRSAAEGLRERGEPFACLVSALGHPELGRRSLLADGLALEWSSDAGPAQKPVIERLREAGLGTLPGTAAEVLDDEVRQILCPDKINTAQWLEVRALGEEIL